MRQKLTELGIERLRFTGKADTVWDTQLRGFGVRILKHRKTFTVLRGHKRQRLTVGHYPSISLQDARKKAMSLLAVEGPQNPATGFMDALEAFVAQHVARLKSHRSMERILRKHFTWAKSVGRITRADVQAILDGLSATPSEANHAFKYVRTFFFWCVRRGILETNPLQTMKLPYKERSRERVLTPAELRSIWHSATDHPFGTIVRLCILTGQRRGEIEYITVTDGLATIPAAHCKNGREHTFPLSHEAQRLFARPLNFNGWSKAKSRLDARSKVKDWTLHDLRRTYATIHAQIATPIHVIEKLLNHVSGTLSGVAGIYNRHGYLAEMGIAVAFYQTHLDGILKWSSEETDEALR